MEATVFRKNPVRYPTPAKVINIIMEDTLRPRRAAAWTTEYNERSGMDANTTGNNKLRSFELKETLEADRPRRYGRRGKDLAWEDDHYDPTGRERDGEAPCGCYLVDIGEPVKDYLSRSSMHGLRYIGESSLHWVERGFWTLAFVTAVLGASYYITILYHKWENEPVIVSLSPRSTSLVAIPFPAVTVCNMNRVKQSEARAICDETDTATREENEDLLNYLCEIEDSCKNNYTMAESLEKNATKKWDTIERFVIKVSPSCTNMLKTCTYGGKVDKCEDLFNPSLTDEGICCTFNRVHRDYLFKDPRDLSDLNVSFPRPTVDWKPEEGYPPNTPSDTVPRRPRGAGSHLGLTLVLNTESDEYFCSSTSSMGFKMLLHSPVETPKIAGFGIALSPGQEYQVAVRPTISTSVPKLRGIPRNKRSCVFADERNLRFYRTYTQRNCALECEANYTLARCKCVLQYMPKNNNTRICGRLEEKCAKAAKLLMELRLVDESANDTEDAANTTAQKRPTCECLPGCSEINYRGEVTSSSLVSLEQISKKEHLKNITDDEEFKKNIAVVHLFFTETQFTSIEKGELFGFTEFLSNTGGLLGLFLGFSFLSVVEICYHLTLKLWCMSLRSNNSVSATTRLVMVKRGGTAMTGGGGKSILRSDHYPYAP